MSETPENLLIEIDDEMILDSVLSDDDADLESLLFKAILFDNFDKVKELIDKGVNVNALDNFGDAPLHHITILKIKELLLEHGADVDIRDEWKNTPLHDAARDDDCDFAELLIKHGADINAKNNDGDTPLHRAMERGNEKIAKLLVDKGADINAKNNDGKTPLDKKTQYELNEALFNAVDNDDISEIEKLIKSGADVNTFQCRWFSPLYMAKTGEVAELLIKNGANINEINDDGETPLYWASVKNRVDVAGVLIKHGADVNIVDYGGCTPLGAAESVEMAELLVQNGANVMEKSPDKNLSLLHYVSSPELAEFFIQHGVDVNGRSDDGTPLDCAKTPEIAAVLVKYGAK